VIKPLLAVLALLVVVPLLMIVVGLAANRPSLAETPGLGQRLKTYLTTNVAQTSPDSPFPELRPPVFPVAAQRLSDAAAAACAGLGWSTVVSDREKGTLHAVVSSRLWRFKDDVRIIVRPAGEGASMLSVRSASRVGKGDLGANTRHVLDLLAAVDAELKGPEKALGFRLEVKGKR
jgi:hypothetical protein